MLSVIIPIAIGLVTGDIYCGARPDPIPNSEVKTASADDT